jgi:hypothetical protein
MNGADMAILLQLKTICREEPSVAGVLRDIAVLRYSLRACPKSLRGLIISGKGRLPETDSGRSALAA